MTSLVLLPGLAADAAMWRHQLESLRASSPTVSDAHTRHASIEDMARALLQEHAGPLVGVVAALGFTVAFLMSAG